MSDQPISRREAMKLAKLGMLMSAGLGISRIVDAKTGAPVTDQTVITEQKQKDDVTNFARNRRLPPNSYIATVMKWTGRDLELVAVVPMNGDVASALRDPAALLSVKLSGAQPGRIATDRWKVYSETEVPLNKARGT